MSEVVRASTEQDADPRVLGQAWRLIQETKPPQGQAGRNLGRASGSSLEFQDFRDYQMGDDLRHVDWRAYARTDQLTVRLYHEELATTLELVIDGSASMDLTSAKAQAWRSLATFLHAAAAGEFSVKALQAGETTQPIQADVFQNSKLPGVHPAGALSLVDAPREGMLRHGSFRVVLSDFLFPHDPASLVAQWGRGAGRLVFIQVLDEGESQPQARGLLRLQEIETGKWRDLPVDEMMAKRYQQRLHRLQLSLEEELRRKNGLWISVNTQSTLEDWAHGPLHESGLIAPR